MVVRFEDGTHEMIKNINDVEHVLTERLGPEPTEAIMSVFKRNLKEKDEEIEALRTNWQNAYALTDSGIKVP